MEFGLHGGLRCRGLYLSCGPHFDIGLNVPLIGGGVGGHVGFGVVGKLRCTYKEICALKILELVSYN